MRGPVAPKDPTAKRQGFYVMQNKTINAAPQPDGRGICFIYEDNGRLESSARLVGNVADEEILGLMGTVSGFRKLVHSIGVSVNAKNSRDDVNFVFQMYGKRDPYGSGTILNMTIPSDGMEYVYELGLADWSDDDNVPGQIRFEFPTSGVFADVSVIFYLNDGFTAPEQSVARELDFNSESYKKIIEKSLISAGNNYRLKKAFEKARSGEDVTIAFIGGSITQGAGAVPINTSCYAYLTYEGLCEMLGKSVDDNIHYVKAGVGGTPSELGMLRYEKDVCNNGEIKPDIVVIEFAVNDEGDETKGECYDSLARKIYNSEGNPAVVLLYAVFANDWNLEERLCIVGEKYNLPMVSTRRSVVDQFYVSEEEGNVIAKNQFFYDMFHPANPGHRIMADGILNMFKLADTAETDAPFDISDITPPIGGRFENVYLVDRVMNTEKVKIDCGDFDQIDSELQFVERDLNLAGTPEFKDNWMYSKNGEHTGKPFSLDVCAKSLLVIFKDSASIEVGTAVVTVDGQKVLDLDPHVVGWTHCNPIIVFSESDAKMHHVEIQITEESANKDFTILGFGVVN